MTAPYFAICQRTPFPGHFEPIPLWQLQHAEYRLGMNVRYYHERARLVGSVLTYPLEDAERIIEYWRDQYPHAEFTLMGYHGD
jgi:hypothetical protein